MSAAPPSGPRPDPAFWAGRRVFLTGHTGFKGTWARLWLSRLGAEVHGYALTPESDPALHHLVGAAGLAGETIADIRDARALAGALAAAAPDVVLHMAAQPLVRRSFERPTETFEVNVMGTVHLLDAVRQVPSVAVALIVTTDKVYHNDESGRTFREDDRLGGHDPYSASKAAAEHVVAAYRASLFAGHDARIATARGGNVLGGGDFSADRLVPDVVRAALAGRDLAIRNPQATRPWQHVLDCLAGYFLYVEALAAGRTTVGALNFGPLADEAPMPVGRLASAVQAALGLAPAWDHVSAEDQPREMNRLHLDPALAVTTLGWRPRLDAPAIVERTAAWYADWRAGRPPLAVTRAQIDAFMEGP
ncbi:CDP-glucose 4,6-dehydratase [Siculibacillus lacustris]|uniref:CDP-glucose 4,6-dehydratase n=1 Tax=Siculibacillus lacustris TaxID=1549641 RepID=UPI001D192C04|nr:CDP-glucose 4,6-dehydratase [Siculibacillus lacustris]